MRRSAAAGHLLRRPAALVAAVLARLSTKPVLIALFLFCAAPAGIFMALLTPPSQVPDEQAHTVRAAGLLHGAVLAVRHDDGPPGRPDISAGVKADIGIVTASYGHFTMLRQMPKVTLPDYFIMRHQLAEHTLQFCNAPNTAPYFPAAYVPAALGMAVGLATRASPFICFMLARLGMLAAFLALGCAALWVAAYGEALLLAVLLLPMTLFLAGSVNQDGVLIGMACFAAAAFTRGLAGSRVFHALALLFLVLFMGSKPPYLPLLGLALLPLFTPGLPRRLGAAVLASLPALAWLALIMRTVMVPFPKAPYHPGPLFGGDRSVLLDHTNAAANLHILLARPALFITLPWHTVLGEGVQKLREMIGILGLFQIQFSDAYYQCWFAALGVALLGVAVAARPTLGDAAGGGASALYVLLLLAVTYWLLMISLYLSWTPVGEDKIEGMQGRYILPLLPFLLLAAPGWQGRNGLRPMLTPLLPPAVAALPALAIGVYDLGALPVRIVAYYYVR